MRVVWRALRSQPVPTSLPLRAPKRARATRVMMTESLRAARLSCDEHVGEQRDEASGDVGERRW